MLEAKKRYGLKILNFTVTSNHYHLLVFEDRDPEVIFRSIQLAACRVGREYNMRKGRRGAFWEDRYHGTAVNTPQYLQSCMVYIDLNMIREVPSLILKIGHIVDTVRLLD